MVSYCFSLQEVRYGVGNARSLSTFYDTFGIDVKKKYCQKNLCSFVQFGTMHRDFVRHLRPDGMGIDYSKINYRFIDPRTEKAS